jgi:hypothetical protein
VKVCPTHKTVKEQISIYTRNNSQENTIKSSTMSFSITLRPGFNRITLKAEGTTIRFTYKKKAFGKTIVI